ncbi:MAG TPA: hypothetical protein VGD54_06015 [Steroidobacteraceae bacterium]
MPNQRKQRGPRIASVTPPALLQVLEELKQREPIFHHPEFGTTRQDYENLTDPEFWEVGASGRRYSREFVLDTLENRLPDPTESPWLTRDFQCREIAADNYLITYTLTQGVRVTRRATLWRRTGSGWKALYHQGTIVEPQP